MAVGWTVEDVRDAVLRGRGFGGGGLPGVPGSDRRV